MKKKNGFTLIELLVVIALMLSILGIAIVSLTGISKAKKDEAWNSVKKQIETAATEYFTANEYLFEGLKDKGTATISVKKLVNEDYLNLVTDPRSGKTISECSLVKVSRENDKFNSSFDEKSIDNDENICDGISILITSDTGRIKEKEDNKEDPDGKSKYEGALTSVCKALDKSEIDASDANGYCYKREFTVVPENLENKKKGVITSIKYCNGVGSVPCNPQTDSGAKDITENYKNFEGYNPGDDNTVENAITVVDIYNNSGALTKLISNTYKIDHEKPTVSISLKTSDKYERYNTADPTIYINGHDNHSGISSYELEGYEELPADKNITLPNSPIYNDFGELIEDFSGETTNPIVTIYDNVGNSSSENANYIVYRQCDQTITKYCKHSYSCPYDCHCDKKGNCDTCYTTCSYYNEYYIDEFNEEYCGGDASCKSNPKPRTKSVTAKAYKFDKLKKYCSNTGTFKFNYAGEKVAGAKVNKSPTGPYRKYEFQELECSCTLTTYSDGRKKITKPKATDITETTHPDGYSYIFYKSAADCENNDKKDVKQVCTQQITGKLNYHGVKWNQGDSNHFSGQGWYFNSYKKKKALNDIKDEDQACQEACERRVGIK